MDIQIALNPQPFPIPYPYAAYDGGERHSFIDLLAEPHRIDEIPESAECPELRRILTSINQPGLPYRSIGCGYWLHEVEGTTPARAFAYIELAYREPAFFRDETYLYRLAHNFGMHTPQAAIRSGVKIRFELRPIHDGTLGARGWGLAYNPFGEGPDLATAREQVREAFATLHNFLSTWNGA